MSALAGKKIAILGSGAMGNALGRGLVQAQAAVPGSIVFSDPHRTHLATLEGLGYQTAHSNHEAVVGADVVIIAVKPFNVRAVLYEIRGHVTASQLVISIAAGIRIAAIQEVLGGEVPVVRAMPNSAAQVNAGACALSAGSFATPEHVRVATEVFTSVGTAVEVPEHLLDAVTALSGSGPAYVYLMIEALVDGGVKVGLPREVAHQLAVQTVLGAARMVFETGKHPAQLKDIVATPGGTTIAALAALEQAGVRAALIDAVEKACLRAKELGNAG